MTQEQREDIKKDIERTIPMFARNNRVYVDEVKSILIDEYVSEDDFIVIPWSKVQSLMDKEGFDINSSIATDEWCLEKYGELAYFVNKQWLNSLCLHTKI